MSQYARKYPRRTTILIGTRHIRYRCGRTTGRSTRITSSVYQDFIRLDAAIELDEMAQDVARVGLIMAIAPSYDQVEYLGLGPHENYPDRLASALFGRYQTSVEELHEDYIVPQENGTMRCPRRRSPTSYDRRTRIRALF